MENEITREEIQQGVEEKQKKPRDHKIQNGRNRMMSATLSGLAILTPIESLAATLQQNAIDPTQPGNQAEVTNKQSVSGNIDASDLLKWAKNGTGTPAPQVTITPDSQDYSAKDWKKELSGEATMSKQIKNGHTLRVVAAEHFSSKAGDYFQNDITKEIQDPSQWLFLIEGNGSDVYEVQIAAEEAKKRNIPVEDPIIDRYRPEVTDLYFKSNKTMKLSREVVFGQLAADILNARGDNNLQFIANYLGLSSSDEIEKFMLRAIAEKNKNPEEYKKLADAMRNDLTEISNILSAQLLNYFMQKYKDRPNIAIYIGKAHQGIIDLDLTKIPDEFKLSDQRIRELLLGRDNNQATESAHPRYSLKSGNIQAKLSGIMPNKVEVTFQEIPNIPENLKNAIRNHSKDLFGLDYVKQRGYQDYLSSSEPLHLEWGAAAHLAELIDLSDKEGRNLTPQEIDTVKKEFKKAADNRANGQEQYRKISIDLNLIADNIPIVEQVMRNLKK